MLMALDSCGITHDKSKASGLVMPLNEESALTALDSCGITNNKSKAVPRLPSCSLLL
jgi:hypothetical protein